jgi:hypothetical protein
MDDPYYFPFEIVNKEQLIPGDNYYMKLNDRVVHKFLDNRMRLPVSHASGVFVRLHTEVDRISSTEYAVFKNVRIMNKNYKLGLCNQMLVRYPEGFLAGSGGCDTFSDNNLDPMLRRNINEEREVFFNIKKWIFGIPTEQKLLTDKILSQIGPKLNEDMMREISTFRGIKPTGGKKNKKSKKRINKISRKRNKSIRKRRNY